MDAHTGAGQLVAIAWNDGTVQLVAAESSKTVHQFCTGDQVSGITCMGWVSNLTSKSSSAVETSKGFESWENFFNHGSLHDEEKTLLDLPRDLALIDIEPSLPKLSVLAAGGGS